MEPLNAPGVYESDDREDQRDQLLGLELDAGQVLLHQTATQAAISLRREKRSLPARVLNGSLSYGCGAKTCGVPSVEGWCLPH